MKWFASILMFSESTCTTALMANYVRVILSVTMHGLGLTKHDGHQFLTTQVCLYPCIEVTTSYDTLPCISLGHCQLAPPLVHDHLLLLPSHLVRGSLRGGPLPRNDPGYVALWLRGPVICN